MKRRDPAALRADRKRRLANSTEAKTYEETAPAANPSPPSTQAETAVGDKSLFAYVLDPSKVDKTANFEMLLFNKESVDPHWVLTADGRPLAEIRLSDQDDAARIAEVFCTDKYARGVIAIAADMPLPELLTNIKGRPYVAAIDASEAVNNIKAKVAAETEEERRRTLASVKADFINMLNFVVKANTKNFIRENVLKDALFNNMKKSGISDDRALAVIEAAFQDKSAEYHEQLFAQASKWSEMSPEAFSEIREQIEDLPVMTPHIARSEEIPSATKLVEANNVPFSTYGGSVAEEVDHRTRVRQVFRFGSRR